MANDQSAPGTVLALYELAARNPEAGDGAAALYGTLGGLRGAVRLASQALALHEGGVPARVPDDGQAPTGGREGLDLDRAGALARIVDLFGFAAGVPEHQRAGRGGAQAAVLRAAATHEAAFRQALDEGRDGDALARRIAEIESAPSTDPRLEAADESALARFSELPATLARRDIVARHDVGADDSVNPLLLAAPFLATPEEILTHPFSAASLRRQAARFESDIADGGPRRDLALARLATGTGVMLLALDGAHKSLITGEHSGNGPVYSVRAGEAWKRYDPRAPIGRVLALAADAAEAMRSGTVEPEDIDDWQGLIAAGALTVAQGVVDRRFLAPVVRLLAALDDPDAAAPADDALAPTPDDAAPDALADIAEGLPELRRRLTPRRNLWGEDPRTAAPRAIDAELQRLGHAPIPIRARTAMRGVPVDLRHWPEEREAYRRRAGNALAVPELGGLGLAEYLDALVSGAGGNALTAREHGRYRELDADARVGAIESAITAAREAAARAVLDDPAFVPFFRHWLAQRNADRNRGRPE